MDAQGESEHETVSSQRWGRAWPPVLADSPSASGTGPEESQGLRGFPSAALTMTPPPH